MPALFCFALLLGSLFSNGKPAPRQTAATSRQYRPQRPWSTRVRSALGRLRNLNTTIPGTRAGGSTGGLRNALGHLASRLRAEPGDVVLGLKATPERPNLLVLGRALGGASYHTWHARGLAAGDARPNMHDFVMGFDDATRVAVATGGRIRFDLTGIDVARALRVVTRSLSKYDPVPSGQYTAWELGQIRSHPDLFHHTDFYVQHAGEYRQLAASDVTALGITPLWGKRR